MDCATEPRVVVQLLPDWTASSVDPRVARFDALIKAQAGVVGAMSMDVLLLGHDHRVLAVNSTPLELEGEGPLAGPSWRALRGALVELSPEVTAVRGVVGGARSAPVERRDATQPVVLRPITSQIGVAGEPHLWWRFFNSSDQPIPVDRIFRTTTIDIDDATFSPPRRAYNGPAFLPPKRGLSGLWSLDDLDPRARRGPHRFRLTILAEAPEPLVFEWGGPA